jgi:predicted Zn finger-like uncharacterized protein
MQIHCPHCRSAFQVNVEEELRADGGREVELPDGLRGEQRYCGDCGRLFSVYVY